MALGNCKECKKEVSTKADRCPHCGIKNPTTKAKDVLVGLLALVFIGFVVSKCSGSDSKTADRATATKTSAETERERAEKNAQCKSDLQCWGDRAIVGAGVYCKDAVERLAKYSVRWTDGTFETKFSRFRWLDKNKGLLTMVGDKAQFQNGFGAYQNVTYECDFEPEKHIVIAVRAEPGKL
jgi:hypothetical protein